MTPAELNEAHFEGRMTYEDFLAAANTPEYREYMRQVQASLAARLAQPVQAKPVAVSAKAASTVPKPKSKRNRVIGFIELGVIAFVLIAWLLVEVNKVGGRSGSNVSYSSQDSANSACQAAIGANLTSPATAHWHNRIVAATHGGYTVSGVVDSENAFGAVLSSPYACDEDSSFIVTNSTN